MGCERSGEIEVLEAKMEALDRLMVARFKEVDARIESHNEFRAQINAERVEYVTRKEIGWLIVTVLALMGVIVAFFSARIG